MEGQPIYLPKPLPLADIALRSIVVSMWNVSDLLSWIAGVRIEAANDLELLDGVETTIIRKLALPQKIRKQLEYLVKPIGLEMIIWKAFHERYLKDLVKELGVLIFEKLHWTSSGVINYRKTAEEYVHRKDVDIVVRYKLACLYCLEDCIPRLWEGLPEEIKTTLYLKDVTNLFSKIREPSLYQLWPYIFKGEESKLDDVVLHLHKKTFHQYAFELSANQGNKSATEYFFQKLPHQERERCLIRSAQSLVSIQRTGFIETFHNFPHKKLPEVLCYVLSLLTPDHQLRIYRERPADFLACFLHWPWQDYFVEISDFIWTYLSEDFYYRLTGRIEISFRRSGYYFPQLFQEFFMRSPKNFRKYFVHKSRKFNSLFTMFFKKRDSETIQVIFRNIDVDDRVQLVISSRFFQIINGLVMGNQWYYVELCLREATLSETDKVRLKTAYMEFVQRNFTIVPEEWNRFFLSFNEIFANAPAKRSLEGETRTDTKKFCCEDS